MDEAHEVVVSQSSLGDSNGQLDLKNSNLY